MASKLNQNQAIPNPVLNNSKNSTQKDQVPGVEQKVKVVKRCENCTKNEAILKESFEFIRFMVCRYEDETAKTLKDYNQKLYEIYCDKGFGSSYNQQVTYDNFQQHPSVQNPQQESQPTNPSQQKQPQPNSQSRPSPTLQAQPERIIQGTKKPSPLMTGNSDIPEHIASNPHMFIDFVQTEAYKQNLHLLIQDVQIRDLPDEPVYSIEPATTPDVFVHFSCGVYTATITEAGQVKSTYERSNKGRFTFIQPSTALRSASSTNLSSLATTRSRFSRERNSCIQELNRRLTSGNRSKAVLAEVKLEKFYNYSRSSIYAKSHLYFLNTRKKLIQMKGYPPFEEQVVRGNPPCKVEDFIMLNMKLVVLTEYGEVIELGTDKTSGRLEGGVQMWSCLAKLGTKLGATRWDKNGKLNTVVVLKHDFTVQSSVTIDSNPSSSYIT